MSIPLPLPPPDYYYNFSNSGNLGRDEAKKREKKTGEKCEKGKALPFGAGREKAEGKSILWFSSGGRRGEAGLRRGKPGPGGDNRAGRGERGGGISGAGRAPTRGFGNLRGPSERTVQLWWHCNPLSGSIIQSPLPSAQIPAFVVRKEF